MSESIYTAVFKKIFYRDEQSLKAYFYSKKEPKFSEYFLGIPSSYYSVSKEGKDSHFDSVFVYLLTCGWLFQPIISSLKLMMVYPIAFLEHAAQNRIQMNPPINNVDARLTLRSGLSLTLYYLTKGLYYVAKSGRLLMEALFSPFITFSRLTFTPTSENGNNSHSSSEEEHILTSTNSQIKKVVLTIPYACVVMIIAILFCTFLLSPISSSLSLAVLLFTTANLIIRAGFFLGAESVYKDEAKKIATEKNENQKQFIEEIKNGLRDYNITHFPNIMSEFKNYIQTSMLDDNQQGTSLFSHLKKEIKTLRIRPNAPTNDILSRKYKLFRDPREIEAICELTLEKMVSNPKGFSINEKESLPENLPADYSFNHGFLCVAGEIIRNYMNRAVNDILNSSHFWENMGRPDLNIALVSQNKGDTSFPSQSEIITELRKYLSYKPRDMIAGLIYLETDTNSKEFTLPIIQPLRSALSKSKPKTSKKVTFFLPESNTIDNRKEEIQHIQANKVRTKKHVSFDLTQEEKANNPSQRKGH